MREKREGKRIDARFITIDDTDRDFPLNTSIKTRRNQ